MSEYFVRNGRRLAGPFSVSELRQMASIGRINRSTLLSIDQQNWIPAAQLEEVFPDYVISIRPPAEIVGATIAPMAPVPPTDRKFPIGVLAGFLVIALAGFLLAADLVTGRRLGLVDLVMPGETGLVADPNDDEKIRKCVGLVVCGRMEMDRKGESLEFPISTGSCFVISADGFVVTNKHVVAGIEPYTHNPSLFKKDISEERYKELRMVDAVLRVYLDGVAYPARIIKMSDRFDMAVLRINLNSSPFFSISNRETIRRNLPVYATGFPSGAMEELSVRGEVEAIVRQKVATTISEYFDEGDFTYTQTTGSVSRTENKSGVGLVIQHTANINKGNSGGPLLDESGSVVGINTFGVLDQNTFYAISLRQLRAEIDSVVSGVKWR